ncbi:Hypothetical protein ORPV_192 [Orpheovirus IHUMI-LCC2]|uniref:Uncharacterized protein n=1 Tax=Orpheovirus IHUMI-LCC2 TaxID=2023057 RepID=A0A2I2L3I4_9VIRU|nr:Hypothetical protein ORPV_192 [Orpheovirus IHUMI-LCC2]SNW62096.1 Hypothetical protein ORPV_192 [Orpheovirus IHUMI-LCC2]
MSEHCIRTPGGTTICKKGNNGSISGTNLSIGPVSIGTSATIKNGKVSKACVHYSVGPYSSKKCTK